MILYQQNGKWPVSGKGATATKQDLENENSASYTLKKGGQNPSGKNGKSRHQRAGTHTHTYCRVDGAYQTRQWGHHQCSSLFANWTYGMSLTRVVGSCKGHTEVITTHLCPRPPPSVPHRLPSCPRQSPSGLLQRHPQPQSE